MAVIKNVAVAGKGSFETVLVGRLLEACYSVTVLTRSRASLKHCPAKANVAEVDYQSVDSLTEALKGLHAVLGALAGAAVPLQTVLIDASIRADYGVISVEPKARELPVAANAVKIQDYLKEKAATARSATPSLHVATIYDGGITNLSATTYATVAKAIAAILHDTDTWKHGVVYVHDTVISQDKVLEMAKRGDSSTTWTEIAVKTAPMMDDFNMSNVMNVLTAVAFNGQYDMAFKKTDNEAFGLGFMSDDQLLEIIARRVHGHDYEGPC